MSSNSKISDSGKTTSLSCIARRAIPERNDFAVKVVFSKATSCQRFKSSIHCWITCAVSSDCELPIKPTSQSRCENTSSSSPVLLFTYSCNEEIMGAYISSWAGLKVPSQSSLGENTKSVSVSRYLNKSSLISSSFPTLARTSGSVAFLEFSKSMTADTNDVKGNECGLIAKLGTFFHSLATKCASVFFELGRANLNPNGVFMVFPSSWISIEPSASLVPTFSQNFDKVFSNALVSVLILFSMVESAPKGLAAEA